MANLPEVDQWVAGIYQLETTDPVLGGPDGVDNEQAKQLANRTLYLKNLLDALTNTVAAKAPLDSAPLTGTPTAPTPTLGDNSTRIATMAALQAELAAAAVISDSELSVRVASTAPINLNAPGAMIDGVAMVAGDAFLEKDHATPSSRGIYIWNGAAVPATRRADADTGTELNSGALISVEEGTANGDQLWMLTTNGVITIGTTGLAFISVGNLSDIGTPGTYNSVTTDAKGRVISGLLLAYAQTNQNNTWTKSQCGAVTALTDAATIALDLSLSNNFSVTLAGNRTLGNPTNVVAGQSGVITVTQDATGSRTLAYGSNYKAVGGIANLPALSTAAGTVDHIAYYVETATRIRLDLGKNVS